MIVCFGLDYLLFVWWYKLSLLVIVAVVRLYISGFKLFCNCVNSSVAVKASSGFM